MIIGGVIRFNGGEFYRWPLLIARNELISTYGFNGGVICFNGSVICFNGGVICINGGVMFIGVSYRWAMLHEIDRDVLYLLDARCMIYQADAEISSVYSRKRYREIREFQIVNVFEYI